MAALILDAFIDPVIGHLSDQTRSGWGRRHPFMYAAAIPVAVLYLLLWNPPHSSQTATLLWLAVIAVLTRTAISCYEVPSSALAPELTSDYHERTSVIGYRYMFGWLGGMGMALLTFGVFLAQTPQYPFGQLNPAGYRTYALFAAAFMALAILLSAAGTHRRISSLPRFEGKRSNFADTLRGIRDTLRNKAYVILLLSGVLSYTSQGLNFALSTYFNTFLWEFPATVLTLLTAAVLLGVALAFAFAMRASRWWGKRNAAITLGLLYLPVGTTPLLLRYLGWFPANGSATLLPLLISFIVLGTALGVGGMIVGSSMMSDVVEYAQESSGKRTEGLFFAGAFFMQKCVSGLGLFVSGAILTAVAFPIGAAPGTVPSAVLDKLSLTYCAITIGLGLIGAAIIWHFPISQADHEQRLVRLAIASARAGALPGSEPEV